MDMIYLLEYDRINIDLQLYYQLYYPWNQKKQQILDENPISMPINPIPMVSKSQFMISTNEKQFKSNLQNFTSFRNFNQNMTVNPILRLNSPLMRVLNSYDQLLSYESSTFITPLNMANSQYYFENCFQSIFNYFMLLSTSIHRPESIEKRDQLLTQYGEFGRQFFDDSEFQRSSSRKQKEPIKRSEHLKMFGLFDYEDMNIIIGSDGRLLNEYALEIFVRVCEGNN
jgi:hypothetical protein